MTSEEFKCWWSDLQLRFPSVGAWLGKCFPENGKQRDVLRTWRDTLAACDLGDCLEVNRQMQAGDLPFVGEYDADKERIPQHVRKYARRLNYERKAARTIEEPVELKPTSFPAGKILRRIIELTESGFATAEAREIVLKELPVGRPSYEPRYYCHLCRDSGHITVASPTAIREELLGRFDECHHRDAVVRCTCKSHLANNPKHPLVVFDDERDFKILDYLWGEYETQRFSDWCRDKVAAFWNGKRHSEFDDFNRERTQWATN